MIYANRIPFTAENVCSDTFLLHIGQWGFTLYMLSFIPPLPRLPWEKYAPSIKCVWKKDMKRKQNFVAACSAFLLTFLRPHKAAEGETLKQWLVSLRDSWHSRWAFQELKSFFYRKLGQSFFQLQYEMFPLSEGRKGNGKPQWKNRLNYLWGDLQHIKIIQKVA